MFRILSFRNTKRQVPWDIEKMAVDKQHKFISRDSRSRNVRRNPIVTGDDLIMKVRLMVDHIDNPPSWIINGSTFVESPSLLLVTAK